MSSPTVFGRRVTRFLLHGILWGIAPLGVRASDDGLAVSATQNSTATAAQEPAVDAAALTEIQSLIRDLGADDFDTRERATDRLWRIGPIAEGALQEAAEAGDRETAFRASRVLERFRLGILVDTPPERVRLIRTYLQGNDLERLQMLRRLIAESRLEDVITLLDRESDPGRRTAGENLVMGQLEMLCEPYLRKGETERLEALFQRFSLNPAAQFLHASVMATRGPEALERLIAAADSLSTEVDPARPTRVKMFAQLLGGNLDAALQTAGNLPDEEERRGWVSTILVLDGRTAAFLDELLARAGDEPVGEALLGGELSLALWAARRCGRQDQTAILEAALDERSIEPAAKLNRIKVELLCGDVEKAITVSLEHDPLLAFSLLAYQDRFVEAFERTGIGLTREARQVWYDETISTWESSIPEEGQAPVEPMNDRTKLAIEVAGWLASVGELDEAGELFDRLFQKLPEKLPNRRLYQGRILELEARHGMDRALIAHADRALGETQTISLFRELKADAVPYETLWFALAESMPDRAIRWRRVHDLLADTRSRVDDAAAIDAAIQTVLGYYQGNDEHAKQVPGWRLGLAELCAANGREAEGLHWLQVAADVGGDVLAIDRMIDWHRRELRWEEVLAAVELRERVAAGGPVANELAPRVARVVALRELGRREEADAVLEQMEAESISLRKMLDLGRALDRAELDVEARRVMRRCRFAPVGNPLPFAGNPYQSALYLAIVSDDGVGTDDPRDVEGLISALLSFDRPMFLEATPRELHPSLYLLNFREILEQADARQALAAGETQRASQSLAEAVKVRPGNVDHVLDFVGLFDQAGAPQELDASYERIRGLYLEVLERFPRSAMHCNNLAWMNARSNRNLDEAVELAKRATTLRPDEDNYWDTLGEVLFRLGRRDEAIAAAERAVALNPTYPNYRRQLVRFRAAP